MPKLEALWSDELIINATENIIYTKDHFLLRLKSGQIHFQSFERKISRITVKSDVVVSTGNESIVPANGPAIACVSVKKFETAIWGKSGVP